jgi:hypothetical protein
MRNISTLKNYTLNALKNASTMVHEEKIYTVLEPDFWHHGTFDIMWRIYPLNALKTASTMVNEEKIHCTGAIFLIIMEQSTQYSLSFYKPSYCAFICPANYEPEPFFFEQRSTVAWAGT